MDVTCVAFIATSLDGYIAKPDGNIDWLNNPDYEIAGEDFGYNTHYQSVDSLIMGRNTYELALSFDSWPYAEKHVYVLSTKRATIPSKLASKVSSLRGDIDVILAELGGRGHKRIYVDGGKTIQGFIKAGRLDEITITRIPILLGEGIPLFGDLEKSVALEHLSTISFSNGFVQSTYSMPTLA